MGLRNTILQYNTLSVMCIHWLLGLSEDLREGPNINKGPLLGYIDSLHLWLPVGLQSIQFWAPYKVRIVEGFWRFGHHNEWNSLCLPQFPDSLKQGAWLTQLIKETGFGERTASDSNENADDDLEDIYDEVGGDDQPTLFKISKQDCK